MSVLFDQQMALQQEGDRLVELLHLDTVLADIGQPVRVGSSALGLMVRRDIDITIICASLGPDTLARFAAVGARLMGMDRHVLAVRFRNDAGPWNADPAAYPDGLYLGLSVRAQDRHDWTLDIWAVDQPARQPDLNHLRTIPPRLTDRHRQIILTLKHALSTRPKGVDVPQSAQVYEAVLDHGVQDLQQLQAWFIGMAQKLPT
ncbi:MAG: hypothetical protein ABI414_13355 [Devosia sp.]